MSATDTLAPPSFPPLMSGHTVLPPDSPWLTALDGAEAGRLGAGDLLYNTGAGTMDCALVLEPEVARARCSEMQALTMVAFGDAAGSVIPSEIGVTYTWPGGVRLNGGLVGHCRLAAGPGDPPDWLVLGLTVGLAPLPGDAPGRTPDVTSFADEGCRIGAVELLESLARHLIHALHRWEEEGFAWVHRDFMARLDPLSPLAPGIAGRLIGLDEHGNAVLDGPRPGLSLWEALA